MPSTLFTNYVTPLDAATLNSLLAGDGASNTGTLLLGQAATDNIGLFTGLFGTSAARVVSLGGQATAPTTSPADAVQLWARDLAGVAGKTALHVRDETGAVHIFGDQWAFNNTTAPPAGIALTLDQYGSNTIVAGRSTEGSRTSPSAVVNNVLLLGLHGYGYGATTYSSAARARVNLVAAETWTDSAQGTFMHFLTTEPTTTTTNAKLRLDGYGNLGVGPNLGTGTAVSGTNAQGNLILKAGVAPTTSQTDTAAMYEADRGGTAGKGSWHLRTEDGTSHVLGDRVGLGTTTPTSFCELAGSLALPVVAKTGAYTATISDSTILCDASGGAFTLTLPTAASITGRRYTIKKTDSSGNAVTVDGNASETIDGATTKSLAAQYDWLTIQSNGTNWVTVSQTAAAGVSGSGADTRVAYWTAAGVLSGEDALSYTYSANRLGLSGTLRVTNGTQYIDISMPSTTAIMQLNGSGTNYEVINNAGRDMMFFDNGANSLDFGNTTDAYRTRFRGGNVCINDATSVGGGVGILAVANAGTNPSTNPSGGGILYADGGAGKWRGSSGTVTTFGPAEPHCTVCHRDYVKEFDNARYGYFALCLYCLAQELGARPWIILGKSRLKR